MTLPNYTEVLLQKNMASFIMRSTHHYAVTFQSHSNICFYTCLTTTHLL